MQLEQAAAAPGAVGAAARAAADLLGPHNAAEERLVLPLLGLAEAVAARQAPAELQRTLAGAAGWDAELPRLLDDQTEVVTALVELFAAADWEGERELAQRAERMIWHEVGDVEVLYPAAALVGSIAQARMTAPVPAGGATARGSLYGPGPIPMMGVGSPHAPADRP
jgi:hypothetical protein